MLEIIDTLSESQATCTWLEPTFDEAQRAPTIARLESPTPRPTLPLLLTSQGYALSISSSFQTCNLDFDKA